MTSTGFLIETRDAFHIDGAIRTMAVLDAVNNANRFPHEWALQAWSPESKAAAAAAVQRESELVASGEIPADYRQMSFPTQRLLALRYGAPETISDGEVQPFLMNVLDRKEAARTAREAFDKVKAVSKVVLLAVAVSLSSFAAFAQTNTSPLPPFVYPKTVSTSPVQVLPQNVRRKSLEFCNPNPPSTAITCAVCPVRSAVDSSAITCAIGGAGSVVLPPASCWGKSAATQATPITTAWNAICSSSSGFTALETP